MAFHPNFCILKTMESKIKNLLHELEKTKEIFWNISPEVGKFLNLLIKDRKYKTILEIGTSNGYSGIWLAEALKKTKGHLYTMESNLKKRYPIAVNNFKKSGLSTYITTILGHAPENIPKTPKIFDLIFFDATKEEHLEYFEALKCRVKRGGIIITDNIISHKKELKNFIKTLENLPSWHSIILNIGSGLMLSIREPRAGLKSRF